MSNAAHDARGGPLAVRLISVLAVAAVFPVLPGCDSQITVHRPVNAWARVQGQVTDPAGAGLADAPVTFTLHETPACSSPVLETSTVRTRADGSYDAGPGLNDVDEDFEPREVCLDVLAEPPEERPDLAPAEEGGFVVTLRTQQPGSEPLDVIEVDLTLPAADAG